MPDYLPKFDAAKPISLNASADVVGGRLLLVSGAGNVAHTTDDAANLAGVAAYDTTAGNRLTVFPRHGVHRLVASGAIAAGARVAAAADGKVQTIGSKTNPIGTALTAAAANNDTVEIILD